MNCLSKVKYRYRFCTFVCLHTLRPSHHHHHHWPAVHSNDVIHIHRSACKARSAFTRLNSFLSLSLHHCLSASPLESLCPRFFFVLFFNRSQYHLLMLFFSLCLSPRALLADLILPALFMFLFPAGFSGGYGLLVSLRQTSLLCFAS